MAVTPVFLPGESPWTEEPGGLHTVHRVAKNWTQVKQLSVHTQGRSIFLPFLTSPRSLSVASSGPAGLPHIASLRR